MHSHYFLVCCCCNSGCFLVSCLLFLNSGHLYSARLYTVKEIGMIIFCMCLFQPQYIDVSTIIIANFYLVFYFVSRVVIGELPVSTKFVRREKTLLQRMESLSLQKKYWWN